MIRQQVKRSLKMTGDQGEVDVVEKIVCPNCGKKMSQLPNSFPLYDLQCTACNFRAQVKSSNSSNRKVVRGADWDIMEKVLKSGFLIPPLITNNKWLEKGVERQEIRLYPFIRKRDLIKYKANIKSRNRAYYMFNYNLKDQIFFVLYKK